MGCDLGWLSLDAEHSSAKYTFTYQPWGFPQPHSHTILGSITDGCHLSLTMASGRSFFYIRA